MRTPERAVAALPALPEITLEIVSDESPRASGFLRLIRRRLRARYADGSRSEPFTYDEVGRRALDAAVMVAFYDRAGERRVYLRSAVRPPVVFRDAAASPVDERVNRGLWELPAGLVEPGESGPEGPRRAAARELEEELGFRVLPAALIALGPSTFPAPGFVAERHFFFAVRVDPSSRTEPMLDGSALERDGRVVEVRLADALSACRSGVIEDSKTELGLRRLAETMSEEVRA